jgi:4Fe-4S single cluster protein
MANPKKRVPENVPGDFFMDSTCIDCDACRQIAPAVFGEAAETSCVKAQQVASAARRQATFLLRHGHEVPNPALPDEDLEAAVRIGQAEYDRLPPSPASRLSPEGVPLQPGVAGEKSSEGRSDDDPNDLKGRIDRVESGQNHDHTPQDISDEQHDGERCGPLPP